MLLVNARLKLGRQSGDLHDLEPRAAAPNESETCNLNCSRKSQLYAGRHKLFVFLMNEARRLAVGVQLKEGAQALPFPAKGS